MSNLSYSDRLVIERWHGLKGISLRDIAMLIDRDVSVVSREITRHKPQLSPYNAEWAQAAADRKAKLTNKKKLDKCPELKYWVEARIKEDHSPEQIAGKLKEQPPPELKLAKVKTLCMETIYQHIYQKAKEGGENSKLYKHLRRHGPKRQKWGQRKQHKVQIPEKVPISQRPEAVKNKERYGDFEIDLLEGKRGKGAVSTQLERKAMLVRLHKVENKKASETTEAIKKTCEGLPPRFIQTMTFDNGGENTGHAQIRDDYEISTYFCEPFKPYQKGAVENMNGLIRQYIPKGTDMTTIDQKYLDYVQEKLNNRPRKSLNYLTPNEVMAKVTNAKCCTKF